MPNTNELETPEDKLKAIQQQIAIYQQQAKNLKTKSLMNRMKHVNALWKSIKTSHTLQKISTV